MKHRSSTQEVPVPAEVPRHVAIIMDGNGRWARRRGLPRIAGHRRGVETVRRMVRSCTEQGVRYLTLFAFSSENWRRPSEEVALLMQLFTAALTHEVRRLHRNGARLRVIGDTARFGEKIQSLIATAEGLTANNPGLTLTVAANYGGCRGCAASSPRRRAASCGRSSSRRISRWPTRRSRTSSSAPAASSA
jgi:undecaprenyl diphosphate synthase